MIKKWLALLVTGFGLGMLTLVAVQAQQKSAQTATRAPAKGPSLTPSDYIEIEQLVARYGHAIDMCVNNGYEYADLYTPDGVFIDLYSDNGVKQGGIRSVGRDQLADAAGGGKFNCRGDRRFELTHAIVNLVITPTAEGAIGKSIVLEMWPDPSDREVNRRAGSYEDVYVKTPQGWRFQQRAHVRKRDKGDPRG
jgi:hypothetical protein